MNRREHRTLAITAVLAVGAPVGAAWWIATRTDDLAQRIGDAGGVRARIGTVDADLSGAVRLSDVALGDLFSADAIEASVGMGSMLDGQLRADEIRVEGPHVALAVDPDGDSDLARLARRLSAHRPKRAAGSSSEDGTRIRRIVVADGTLVARIAGLGELSADGVELLSEPTGIRVLTGPLRVRAADDARRIHVELSFAKSAAEVTPQMKFGRVLAVGGSGTASSGGATLALRDLAAGRRAAGGPLEIRAVADDNGVPRTAALEVSPIDLSLTLRGERFPLRAFAPLAPHGVDLLDTRATGSLVVRRANGGIDLVADGSLEHLVVADRRISADPVALSFGLRGDVHLTADAITVPSATIQLGTVSLSTTGWIRRGKPISGQLELELPVAPCQTLLAALPDPLRGPLDGMSMSGSLGGHVKLSVDLAAPEGEGATLTSALQSSCQVGAEPPAADVTTLAGTQAIDQQLADGSRIRVGPNEPSWIALKSLPYFVIGAFVSAEDARFWDHPGFDITQIARSLEIDLREDRLARGGSTISQQLVKNAFLSQRRSFDRKLQEAILTWRLENRLQKKQILERYLNIIELGPKIWGLRAAAKHWFNVSPRELTVKQAAFLAALTSQPGSMSRRIRKAGALDPDTAERVGVVLWAMRRDGAIDEDTYLGARNAPLGFAVTATGNRDER